MKISTTTCRCAPTGLLPICTGAERLKNSSGDKLHPTQKPEALLHRVLLSSSNLGDVVLDPFFGTGTTGAVAKRLGRHLHRHRARRRTMPQAARARIEAVEAIASRRRSGTTAGKRAEPRIPFGSLIERGLVKAGETLYDPAQRIAPRVRADGSIACRDASGSIHQIGAHVQGAEACNGWTFWHVRKGTIWCPSTCSASKSARLWRKRIILANSGLRV